MRVYRDLENTLCLLRDPRRRTGRLNRSIKQINVTNLIRQLSKSKQKLEKKIQKALKQEKLQIRRQLKCFVGIRRELKRLASPRSFSFIGPSLGRRVRPERQTPRQQSSGHHHEAKNLTHSQSQ